MNNATTKLDPGTMVAVLDILLEEKMASYYGSDAKRPEDMATMNCLAAQRNYWASKAA
jgi:hypothetical protein